MSLPLCLEELAGVLEAGTDNYGTRAQMLQLVLGGCREVVVCATAAFHRPPVDTGMGITPTTNRLEPTFVKPELHWYPRPIQKGPIWNPQSYVLLEKPSPQTPLCVR